jgi:hypothetical protein
VKCDKQKEYCNKTFLPITNFNQHIKNDNKIEYKVCDVISKLLYLIIQWLKNTNVQQQF